MNDENTSMLEQLETLLDALGTQIVYLEASMDLMREDIDALEHRLNNLRNEG